ncbi:hypothetical protein IGI04_015105 [Brassica rapa subsp. trilocularis]|uniref:Protein kinase domain-containing protein n=1 Tax=Brassica rapa subsp. trilocularis TaxID=1813537 RepID=A0ABQ7MQL0_BRACM|nr:hypothetical protein IGI04_015105 [Brassica rapa subsp. trilocularis]
MKKINDVSEYICDTLCILCENEFKDIYVVFEQMESDLHHVIKANEDLKREPNVYHHDLKLKNILANANCKFKVCNITS